MKIPLVDDRLYLDGTVMVAARLESYRAIHNGHRRLYLISKWVGIAVCVTGLTLNVPAVAVIGAAVAWWAENKK